MLKLIYGAKGSGKTKAIIDLANKSVEASDGAVVFITDTDRYMLDISNMIRKINIKEHKIVSEAGMLGFFKGVLAGNHDITHLFIDGVHRILKKDVDELEAVYKKLEELAAATDVKIILTVSRDIADMPEYLKKYVE